jgi:hypothetical protein
MPQEQDLEAVSLRQWIDAIADPNVDPFPDGAPDTSPVAADAVVITHKRSSQSRADMVTDGEISDRFNDSHILPSDVVGVYAQTESDLLQGRAKVVSILQEIFDSRFLNRI